MSEKNTIYERLANLSHEEADKITNAKTGGGRSLNAIHASKSLSQIEKHLLLVLGSEMNFCKDFANQYRFISLNDLADKLSVNQRTVSAILNGVKRKKGYEKGLIEKGYVKKKVPSLEEQKNCWKTHYCITNKIFDEYMIFLIQRTEESVIVDQRGSDRRSEGGLIVDQRGSDRRSDKDPSYKDPSYKDPPNAATQSATAMIRSERTAKKNMKTWAQKSNDEKMQTILHMSFDVHTRAVEQKRANYLPFDDFPEILKPIIEGYGVEKLKEFFDDRKKQGCDIRAVEKKLDESVSEMTKSTERSKPTLSHENIHQIEEKINSINENFSMKILTQMKANMIYANKCSKKELVKIVKVEDFPVRLKKFYDSIDSKFHQRALIREISAMGLDKFLELRAPAILKCSHAELFIESAPEKTSFADF